MTIRDEWEQDTGKKWYQKVIYTTDKNGINIKEGRKVREGYVRRLEFEVQRLKSLLEWRHVSEELPKKDQAVLASYKNCYGKRRRVRAVYVRQYEQECLDLDDLNYEYSEEKDECFIKEGWYECVDNWPEYSTISISEGEIDIWTYLTPLPEDV